VLDLARGPGRRVAVALLPIDALTAIFTLLANRGVELFATPDAVADTDATVAAFELLAEVTSLAHPMSLQSSPIHVLEAMSTGDEVHYSPLLFGYSNYSRAGFRDHLIEFGAFPTFVPGAFDGGVLGGAGLAVSAATSHPREAFALVDFLMSGDTQAGTYVLSGGQPGHRRAWLDPEANAITDGYFVDTLPVMDRQFVRPRHSGYLLVQGEGGDRIHRFLSEGGPAAEAVADLDAIYRRSIGAT
jgi:multiple sugar transport system substrate-binding protein